MTKARQFENALVSFAMDYPAILDEEGVRDLQPADFENGNGQVWKAIQAAHADGGVTPARIAAALPGQGYDLQYFAALRRDYAGVTWAGAQEMARHLRLHSRRVQLRAIASGIAQAASRNEQDALTIAAEAIDKLAALSREGAGEPEMVGEALPEVREYIEARVAAPGDVWGLSYGLPKLDRFTGGAHHGEFDILAGEPGIGKSYLSEQFSLSFGLVEPGAYFSLEMKRKRITLRMMSLLGVDTWKVNTGRITEADRMTIANAERVIQGRKIFIEDDPCTLPEIRASLSRLKAKHNIGWFIVDYMGLVQEKAKDENERSDKVARELKNICHSMDLFGLGIASVNKTGMDTEVANKAAMSGSGQQIHHADNVFFLTADSSNPGNVSLTCKKGRDIPNSTNRKMTLRKPAAGQPFLELETNRVDTNKEQL